MKKERIKSVKKFDDVLLSNLKKDYFKIYQ